MEFWIPTLLVVGAICVLFWAWNRQSYRKRFISFAEVQRRKLDFLSNNLPLTDQPTLSMRRGEHFIYELDRVHLIETRRGPRISRRSGDAITVALAKGVYYTATGGRSVSEEPADELRIVDSGSATFTDKRVVFVGSKFSREWDFAKLTGWQNTAGGNLMMGVTNRQKMSGITLQAEDDLMPSVVLEITQIAREDGLEAARESCRRGALNAAAQRDFARANTWVSSAEIEAYVSALESSEIESTGDSSSQKSKQSPSEILAPDTNPKNADVGQKFSPDGFREIEIFGEEKFAISFADIQKVLGGSPGSEHIVECELVSERRKAKGDPIRVSIYIRDRLVGYLPEPSATSAHEAIERAGNSIQLGGRIKFADDQSQLDQNAVTIYLDSRLSLD